MATDNDASRKTEEEQKEESLEAVACHQVSRTKPQGR